MSRLLALVLLLAACGTTPSKPPTPPKPTGPIVPVAEKLPTTRTLHGDTFVDDYFWLREKDTPPVLDYLRAEEAYADAVTKPLEALRETLFQEIVGHIAEDDETVPAKDRNWLYWRRTVKGQSYPIYLRKLAKEGTPEQVMLDVNQLAEGKAYMGLGSIGTSDDGRYLLFTTDETGFRSYTLHVKDLDSGEVLSEAIPHVVGAAWTSADKTLVYVVEDDAKRPYRLYRHTVGKTDDVLMYEEADARFELWAWRSASREALIVHSESKLQTEVRIVDAAHPEKPLTVVEPRSGEHLYYVDQRGKNLVIRTNDAGKNFRIVTAPVAKPGKTNWKELIAHDAATMLEDHGTIGARLVLTARKSGIPELLVYDFQKKTIDVIATPDPVHEVNVDGLGNLEPDATSVRYTYESFATPRSTFSYDFKTKQSTRLKEDAVPGGFDRNNYVTERISAKAADGTDIPISIVRRKDVALDGKAPLHLYGYGSYGVSIPLSFSAPRLVLLDHGVIYALAHIRGGGDLGKAWHEGGRLATKMNTFTDFIACAEHLVKAGYTSSQRMSIEGASAGGLLMGAVLNLRPDLFKAALVKVPFVDVVNTMNDATLPLTITEYEEWGNPTIAEQYGWIRPYSPYDNIKAQAYPAILVKTSYYDSQVMYWEPAKWVARLRALKTDANPLLFKVNLEAGGHGGKSGRYDRYRETAYDQAFLLWQLGVVQP